MFQIEVQVADTNTVTVQCCAVDANYNRQPEDIKNIWNLRGALSNAWHTININIKKWWSLDQRYNGFIAIFVN